MAELNSTIMEKVWLYASNDFQQRIPAPTQGQIAKTVDALFDPMNRSYFNDFMSILINRIAFTYVRGQRWNNKLAIFKGQKINYGSTIQEIAPNWIKAHAYNVSDETLLKLARPEAGVWYHSQNRQDRYDISISYDDLRTAFVDEYGLNNFIAKVMEVPINSDEYDEYRIMLQLLAEYDNRFGFFKTSVGDLSDEASCKNFLMKLREYAGLLEFPSAHYNALNVDIPVFAKNNELVILMTPYAKSRIDVSTLSGVFQLDKADIEQRIVIVDEFPMPDTVALLTTEDFFVCHDTVYENTNFWNPQTLANNYYLHHWGIYSVSPFVPAILFTVEESTDENVVTMNLSGISLNYYKLVDGQPDENETPIIPGDDVQIDVHLAGTLIGPDAGSYSGDKLKLAPDAATYEIQVMYRPFGSDMPETIDKGKTYIDRLGVLHIDKDLPFGTNDSMTIIVTATCTYISPSTAGDSPLVSEPLEIELGD